MRSVATKISHAFATAREVPIRDCVHFCAYRYGHNEPNPYERYAISLAAGLPIAEIRENFIDTIARYRPRNLGQAIGAPLSMPYPLWWLPWRTPEQVKRSPGWVASTDKVADIMTHFSEQGIPRGMLEREFRWHENAFDSLYANGYQPDLYSYITARELQAERSSYLLVDGNHRLSSLSAMGLESVRIKLPLGTAVVRSNAQSWPLVRAGMVTLNDALAIFDAYHFGNRTPISSTPAPIIE